jgi:hypothetical protein
VDEPGDEVEELELVFLLLLVDGGVLCFGAGVDGDEESVGDSCEVLPMRLRV